MTALSYGEVCDLINVLTIIREGGIAKHEFDFSYRLGLLETKLRAACANSESKPSEEVDI